MLRIARLKEAAVDLLFPQWCLGCGREGAYICPSCRQRLPRLTESLCPTCGQPQPGGQLCPACVRRKQRIDGIRAPFRFDGLIRQAIHQLKYRNLRALAQPLAGLLHDYISANPVPGEVLVPVPIHPGRLRQRGYNQCRLLAAELSKISGLPLQDGSLAKRRPTEPQAETDSLADRWANVAGAYSCLDAALSGRKVLLVDDVATSGATLNACAEALKTAGASSVWALVLAREV
jgi:ComF family protein